MVNSVVTVGPWGNMQQNARSFSYITDSITQISLTFTSVDYFTALVKISVQGDQVVFPSKLVGNISKTITIDGISEYLIGIKGTYFPPVQRQPGFVDTLGFITNTNRYGPYGSPINGSIPFQYLDTGGARIVGFHGTGEYYCESIALYLRQPLSPSGIGTSSGNTAPQPYPGAALTPTTIRIRHWGGQGGKRWIFNPESGIRRIVIVYQSNAIESIRFTSVDNEVSQIFGANAGIQSIGSELAQIDIDYPREHIISISGLVGLVGYDTVIRSLHIDTNQRQHGPFGDVDGVAFSLTIDDGMIAGFHGTAGALLNSIGVFLRSKP